MGFPRVSEGNLLVFRLFDVADDIDLARAEAILHGEGERLRLVGERPGFLDLPDPPISVVLGPRDLRLDDGPAVAAEAHLRLFAHGVASVRYEIPLDVASDEAAVSSLVRRCSESAALERTARAEAERLCDRLRPALVDRHSSPLFETYAIVLARALEGGATPAEVGGPALARVLLGEPPSVPLADRLIEEVTRHRFSYTRDDLCVLDWDAAFVLEPGGERDVAAVLELATAQLLEFRYYDALLEEQMLSVTEILGNPRRGWLWLFAGRYARVGRRVHHVIVESAEFVERVENAVRVVGDLYLARVYRAAVERLRIGAWEAGVLRRRQVAAEVASLLSGEANAALGHVLEASILALIVLEIALALR